MKGDLTMKAYNIGLFIKKKREEQHIRQEDLCRASVTNPPFPALNVENRNLLLGYWVFCYSVWESTKISLRFCWVQKILKFPTCKRRLLPSILKRNTKKRQKKSAGSNSWSNLRIKSRNNLFCDARRWHISLSSWFRDYLYIPLGGNRKGKIRQYANLVITMFLGGLWHGASWNFVVWGLFHGIALAAHKFWMTLTGRKKGEESHGIRRFFGILITFHFVCFCWIFFRNADFSTSLDMIKQICTTFRPQLFPQLIAGYWEVFVLMALGFFLHFCPDRWENACCKTVTRLPLMGKAVLMLALIYLVIQMKSTEIQPFIYFQF